jgi:hypothetical protein
MKATLLHQDDTYDPYPDTNLDEYGEWDSAQDPLTGEIVRVWQPYTNPVDPSSPSDPPTLLEIPCLARGIVDGGIRVAGTTEWFGSKDYRSIDYVRLWVPPNVNITKRDRVTNIKDTTGKIIWRNEEYEPQSSDKTAEEYNQTVLPTLFNVNGVTPLLNAFNRTTEQYVLLENAEIQEPVDA